MSIFPTRILVAVDGSEEAKLAASTAVDLADCTGCDLHLVTVCREYTPVYYEVPGPVYCNPEAPEQDARAVLDDGVRRVEEAGGKVAQTHIRRGERRDREIVDLAEEIGAGLIVMGCRGLGGLKRTLMGSVSDSVVRHAHCPVLVVREVRETARASETGGTATMETS